MGTPPALHRAHLSRHRCPPEVNHHCEPPTEPQRTSNILFGRAKVHGGASESGAGKVSAGRCPVYLLPPQTHCHISGLNKPVPLCISPHNTDGSSQTKPRLTHSIPSFSHRRCEQEKPNQKLENVHILQEQQPLSRLLLSLPAPQEIIDHHHLFNAQIRGRQTQIPARCCTVV